MEICTSWQRGFLARMHLPDMTKWDPMRCHSRWRRCGYLLQRMFTLFKVYQFLMYSIWLWFSYLLVGGLLLSIVLIAAAITITNRRRSQSSIAKLTEYESIAKVQRDGTWRTVDFRMLVPGDVVKVTNYWKLPCDLLIIQGMSTSRGRLLSTILFPEQVVFKYDEELPIAYRNGQQSGWITKWSYCVAIVSQIVPPLLPVALEIGQIYASQRLKNHGVYFLNAKRIAIAGKIRVFCFDKTGTLSNDGLDFVGVQGVKYVSESSRFQFRPTQSPWKHERIDDVILRGFATCHAVAKFGAQFVGNEVEVKMFASVGWDLLEEGTAAQQFPVVINRTTGDVQTIVRRNEFEHARATMSVVVQDHTGELHVYCKGSFERIQELSTLASLPLDYLQTAKDHALDGCYALGLGHKSLGTDLSLDQVALPR